MELDDSDAPFSYRSATVCVDDDSDDDGVIFLGMRRKTDADMEEEEEEEEEDMASDFASSPEQSSGGEQEDAQHQRNQSRGKKRGRRFTTGKAARSSQRTAAMMHQERHCALCFEGERADLSALQLVTTRLRGRGKTKPTDAWVHTDCIYYASRRTSTESQAACVSRAIQYAIACKVCKKTRASVGCIVDSCRYICHFPCAIVSGGDYVEGKGFYCPQHIALAKQRLLRLVKWPQNNPIQYVPHNIWDDIAPEDIVFLQTHKEKWEEHVPSFLTQNFECKVYIQEIQFGHWAYCHNLHNEGIIKQYEVRALVNIEEEELIGEYTGRIRYQKDIRPLSHYVANFWYPQGLDNGLNKELCVDAELEGNEMRYINSIAPTTAFYIRQNARMSTVWCRGQLRIFMIATRSILKGQPIITNYNEHSSTFFEENLMPVLPGFSVKIPPIPDSIVKSGKKPRAANLSKPAALAPQEQSQVLRPRLAKRSQKRGSSHQVHRSAATDRPPQAHQQAEVIVLD